MEKSDKQKELEKWLNDERYIQIKELVEYYGISRTTVRQRLREAKINPIAMVKHKTAMIRFYLASACKAAIEYYVSGLENERDACLSDDSLIQLHEMAAQWNTSKSAVASFLNARKISSCRKIRIGRVWHAFFDKKECLRARQATNSCEAKEHEANPNLIQKKELSKIWKVSIRGVLSFLQESEIRPVHILQLGGRLGSISFYEKSDCLNAREIYLKKMNRNVLDANPESENEKLLHFYNENNDLIQLKELEYVWNVKNPLPVLSKSGIKPHHKISFGRRGHFSFYSRAECEAARPFIKEVKNEMEEQKLINTPLEDDFIPADTLDSYSLTALTAKLKEKSANVENFKADLFDNHADEDIKRIGMLIRGSIKSVNLWGRQIDEVVNVCGKKEDDSKTQAEPKTINDDDLIDCFELIKLLAENTCKNTDYLSYTERYYPPPSCSKIADSGGLPSRHVCYGWSSGRYHKNAWKKEDVLKWAADNFHRICKCKKEVVEELPVIEKTQPVISEPYLAPEAKSLIELHGRNTTNKIRSKLWNMGYCTLHAAMRLADMKNDSSFQTTYPPHFVVYFKELPQGRRMWKKECMKIWDIAALKREVAENQGKCYFSDDLGHVENKTQSSGLESRVESLEKEVSSLKSFISDLKILLAKHA